MTIGGGGRGLFRFPVAARVALAMAVVMALGCRARDEGTPVNLAARERVVYREPDPAGLALRFAVGGMIVPREGYAQYRQLLELIERKLGRPIKLVDRDNYAAINKSLQLGELDAAFVCSGPYVEGKKSFGLELLVVPVAYGRTVYHSYFIVHKDSRLGTLEDLRGKTFAFTDPDSNTGRIVPLHLLATMRETPESFFSRSLFTGSHDKSILAVAQKLVDGAAVDSLIWDYARRNHPESAAPTRVTWTSPPYGIPPVVTRPGLDPAVKGRLKEIFLALDRDAQGREILGRIMIDRFTEGRDADYDSIRAMQDFVACPAPPPQTAPAP